MRLKPAFLTQISALHMSIYKLSVLHLLPKCPAHTRQTATRGMLQCRCEHTPRCQPSPSQRFAMIWTSRPTEYSLRRPESHHNKNKVYVTPRKYLFTAVAIFQSSGSSHYLKIRISVTTDTTKETQHTACKVLFYRTPYCLGPKNTKGRQVLKGTRGI